MAIDIERQYKLYKHTNMFNKKVYIGITKQPLHRRWRNGKGYKNNPHFYRAIQKYGWDNFQHQLIFQNLTAKEAENLESIIIQYYKSNQRDFGYNIEGGGNINKTVSDETRAKMRRNHADFRGKNSVWFGKKHTEETKNKISKYRKENGLSFGEKNPMYGKRGEKSPLFGRKHTEESKQKMREALKNKNGIKIICLNNNEIYCSIRLAGRKLGLSPSSITKNCKGQIKSVNGFIFKYYNQEDI